MILSPCTPRVRPNTAWGSRAFGNMLTTYGIGSGSLLLPLTSPFNKVAVKGAAVNGTDESHPFQVWVTLQLTEDSHQQTINRRGASGSLQHNTSLLPLFPLTTTTISSDLACRSAVCQYAYAQRVRRGVSLPDYSPREALI